jgi:hypothetical protein
MCVCVYIQILGKLEAEGFCDELRTPNQVWRLAHLVAARDHARVNPGDLLYPVKHAPLLDNRVSWNPTTAFVEAPECGSRRSTAGAITRFEPGSGNAVTTEGRLGAPVHGATRGLVKSGFKAVSKCCGWENGADRAEAISYVLWRLCQEGAAPWGARGSKLRPQAHVVEDSTHEDAIRV